MPQIAKLKVVEEREGRPGHRPVEVGVRLAPQAPPMPDWRLYFPPVTLGRKPPAKPPSPKRAPATATDEEKLIASRLKMAYLVELYDWRAQVREYDARRRLKAEAERCRRTAKATWEKMVPVLDAQGLLATVDSSALEEYCILIARIQQAERDITQNGIWVPGERGAQKNPATTFVNQCRANLRSHFADFGLTPLARDRLNPRDGGNDGGSLFD